MKMEQTECCTYLPMKMEQTECCTYLPMKMEQTECCTYLPMKMEQTEYCTYLPMKMEETECSETSAYKFKTPGNHPKESIQHSVHGESLKSRILELFIYITRPASNEIFSHSNKINREVGRAKDLSAPLYFDPFC